MGLWWFGSEENFITDFGTVFNFFTTTHYHNIQTVSRVWAEPWNKDCKNCNTYRYAQGMYDCARRAQKLFFYEVPRGSIMFDYLAWIYTYSQWEQECILTNMCTNLSYFFPIFISLKWLVLVHLSLFHVFGPVLARRVIFCFLLCWSLRQREQAYCHHHVQITVTSPVI